jgi:DNA mismatch repair protein MutL
MSAKIRVLDENTINKIAAGEVIENPSSVVKELVENSIDAGATEISIEIKTGGRQLIRISDNGCGMNQDDAVLSLERHATSKLRNIDDIFNIGTMGFRGEAVPSIASISKFTLITNDNTDKEGTMVIVDGGKIYQVAPAARSRGTTMEVKNLFFNVPVRRKFQRSPTYDANEILKVVSIQAMGYPEIKFELISDGKILLSAMRTPDLQTRVKDIQGAEFGRSTLPIKAEHDAYKIDGVIGYPTYTRQNRTGQYLYINKRAITSPIVAYAVRDGYGTSLSTTRHPVWILHLTIPNDLIDVNVHPQKREVRLRQQDEMRQFILEAVNNALGGKKETAEPEMLAAPAVMPIVTPTFDRPLIRPAFTFEVTEKPAEYTPPKPFAKPQTKLPEPTFLREVPQQNAKVIASIPSYLILDGDTLPQRGEGLCLLDQRAAHRRIIYESLNRDQIEVQPLLIPITWHLSPQEMELVKEHLDAFRKLAIHLHESGPDSFMIDAIPSVLKSENIETVLQDVLHKMDSFHDKSFVEKELEKQIAEAAGRAAISSKAKLSIYEAQKLVDQLMKCKNPLQCPLGKPILKQISPEDLALQFRSH